APITVPLACLNAPKAGHFDQDLERAGCKSVKLYAATTYTQFATWAAHTIRCRVPEYGYLKRMRRTFKVLVTSTNQGAAV
ncbi:hypothetical protein, partial [Paraburkholderia sp. SIMBA_054]|uniref:hypothetical protein n=1 Tax=Paraburkholderia sp. SIMBA_054 TaxID=3085795 RepID=UPI00397AD470